MWHCLRRKKKTNSTQRERNNQHMRPRRRQRGWWAWTTLLSQEIRSDSGIRSEISVGSWIYQGVFVLEVGRELSNLLYKFPLPIDLSFQYWWEKWAVLQSKEVEYLAWIRLIWSVKFLVFPMFPVSLDRLPSKSCRLISISIFQPKEKMGSTQANIHAVSPFFFP